MDPKYICFAIITGFFSQLEDGYNGVQVKKGQKEILNTIKIVNPLDRPPYIEFSGTKCQIRNSIVYLLYFIQLMRLFRKKNARFMKHNKDALMNLKCHKLFHFQWYKNTYLKARLQSIPAANLDYQKDHFIPDTQRYSLNE